MAALNSLVASTELDAVNIMLGTIGEAPVSSLSDTGLTDVAIAKTILAEQNRAFQAMGWDFNTDLDYQLALDLDSKCPIPSNAMRIDTTHGEFYVERAGFFWDRQNNTFVLTDAPYCDIVRYFAFEDMPESARYYVTVVAARIFQKRMLGDDSLEVFTEKEESKARANFEDSEQSSADRNMLKDPATHDMVYGGRANTHSVGILSAKTF